MIDRTYQEIIYSCRILLSWKCEQQWENSSSAFSAEGKEGNHSQWNGIKTEGRAQEPIQEERSESDERNSLSEAQQLQ